MTHPEPTTRKWLRISSYADNVVFPVEFRSVVKAVVETLWCMEGLRPDDPPIPFRLEELEQAPADDELMRRMTTEIDGHYVATCLPDDYVFPREEDDA